MQESTDNVGVGTTVVSDQNGTGGLIQCEGSPQFGGQHGLSQNQVSSMVTAGTKHYKSNLDQVGDTSNAQSIDQALRLYNSGHMNADSLIDPAARPPAMSRISSSVCREPRLSYIDAIRDRALDGQIVDIPPVCGVSFLFAYFVLNGVATPSKPLYIAAACTI
jgi:hypothetical protein